MPGGSLFLAVMLTCKHQDRLTSWWIQRLYLPVAVLRRGTCFRVYPVLHPDERCSTQLLYGVEGQAADSSAPVPTDRLTSAAMARQ